MTNKKDKGAENMDTQFTVPGNMPKVTGKMAIGSEFTQSVEIDLQQYNGGKPIDNSDLLFDILSNHHASEDPKITTGLTIPIDTRDAISKYSDESGFSKGMVVNALLAQYFKEINDEPMAIKKSIRTMHIDNSNVKPLTIAFESDLVNKIDAALDHINMTRSKLISRILYNVLLKAGYPVGS